MHLLVHFVCTSPSVDIENTFRLLPEVNLPNFFGQTCFNKEKYLRVNHANFMIKQLRKAIMKRLKLRNDFLKDRNDASQSAYRKQRNLCVTLLRKAKKQCFLNLEPKLITDNKIFWKSVKPLFSDKITFKEIINLSENGEILS